MQKKHAAHLKEHMLVCEITAPILLFSAAINRINRMYNCEIGIYDQRCSVITIVRLNSSKLP